VPKAADWDGYSYYRIDLDGSVQLTNYGEKPVEIQVVRNVLGNTTSAGADGKIESLNLLEDTDYAAPGDYGNWPYWWSWYSWPYWWNHFNGVSRITWNLTLEPKKDAELKYAWSYYWR
jgi:hypothetical protein